MSELQWFQRYHTKENVHSSNAMFLLKRLYFYSPIKFFKTLNAIFDTENVLSMPNFIFQDTQNGKGSIPDFSIMQDSFKIIVEAKEGGKFNYNQLDKHLKGLSENTLNCNNKMLIALSPRNEIQSDIEKLRQEYRDIRIVHKTYIEFYDILSQLIDQNSEFYEVLEDYRDYCEEENLIDYTDDTLMVRLAGDTFDFNYENNVYYDGHSNNAHGFRYIGLYKKQHVQAIGKISKIIEAHIEGDEIKYNCYGDMISYVGKRIITDNEKRIIDLAIKDRQIRYENITVPHWHYIVEKFIPVENFKKQKGALMGKKKFYLKEDFEINDIKNCMIEDIAIAMNKKSDIWK